MIDSRKKAWYVFFKINYKKEDLMKAKIVFNLMHVIENYFGRSYGHRDDSDFVALCDRIAGKEVDLRFIGNDAFEEIDNNYWLPNCCWEKV